MGNFNLAAINHFNSVSINLLNQVLLAQKVIDANGELEPVYRDDLVDLAQLVTTSTPLRTFTTEVRDVTAGELRAFRDKVREIGERSPKLKNIVEVAFRNELSLADTVDRARIPDENNFDDLDIDDDILIERIGAFNTENLLKRVQDAALFYTATLQNYQQSPDEVRKQVTLIKNALLRRSFYRN